MNATKINMSSSPSNLNLMKLKTQTKATLGNKISPKVIKLLLCLGDYVNALILMTTFAGSMKVEYYSFRLQSY